MGFAGANVTIPHKQAVIALCDEPDESRRSRVGQHPRLRGDRLLGSSTDGDAVSGQVDPTVGAPSCSEAVARAGRRRGARAGRAEVTVATRRQEGWPPSADGYDILVNATPVKDEVIVAPHGGMEVVDLAYLPDGRDTALVAAARAAGCDVVVDGLDVLLFQGPRFERWTGLRPPRRDARRAARHLTSRRIGYGCGMDAALLEAHVERFNEAVRSGDFTDAGGICTDAEMAFEGAPAGPFLGRDAIAVAYAAMPPTDEVLLLGAIREERGLDRGRLRVGRREHLPRGPHDARRTRRPDRAADRHVRATAGLTGAR